MSTPDALLDELVEAATAFSTCPNPPDPQTPDEWMLQSKWRDARDRLREARTAVAALIARETAYRNALEHIAGSCEGRAAEVAKAALDGTNTAASQEAVG